MSIIPQKLLEEELGELFNQLNTAVHLNNNELIKAIHKQIHLSQYRAGCQMTNFDFPTALLALQAAKNQAFLKDLENKLMSIQLRTGVIAVICSQNDIYLYNFPGKEQNYMETLIKNMQIEQQKVSN